MSVQGVVSFRFSRWTCCFCEFDDNWEWEPDCSSCGLSKTRKRLLSSPAALPSLVHKKSSCGKSPKNTVLCENFVKNEEVMSEISPGKGEAINPETAIENHDLESIESTEESADDESVLFIDQGIDYTSESELRQRLVAATELNRKNQWHQRRFFEGIFLLNRQGRNHLMNEADMKDLVIPEGLQKVLATTFNFDMDYITDLFAENLSFLNKSFEQLLIIPHYDVERCSPGLQSKEASLDHDMPADIDTRKVQIIFPDFPRDSNCRLSGLQHSKLMILIYPSFTRMIVSSKNLTHNESSQVIFVADSHRIASRSKNTDDFTADLIKFLEFLRPSVVECQKSFEIFKEWIEHLTLSSDFSSLSPSFRLVYSVPGTFQDSCSIGFARFKQILKESGVNGSELSIDSYSSSLGALEGDFLRTLYETFETNEKSFSVIWPSVFQMVQDDGIKGKSCMFITRNEMLFNEAEKPGSSFTLNYNFKPLILSPNRKGMMLHAKVLIGYNRQEPKFLYFGSHNLSRNAWGYWRGDLPNREFICQSYELGVVCVCPSIIEKAPLPFVRTSKTYGECLRRNEDAELLNLSNESVAFKDLLLNSELDKLWYPYHPITMSSWRKCSNLALSVVSSELTVNESKSLVAVYFCRSSENVSSSGLETVSGIGCLLTVTKLFVVNMETCDFGSKLILFRAACMLHKLKNQDVPVLILFSVEKSSSEFAIKLDPLYTIKCSSKIPKLDLSLTTESMAKGIYKISLNSSSEIKCRCKRRCIGAKAMRFGLAQHQFDSVEQTLPDSYGVTSERRHIVQRIIKKYDLLVFGSVFRGNPFKPTWALLPGLRSFLTAIAAAVEDTAGFSFLLAIVLNLPQVGLSQHVHCFPDEKHLLLEKNRINLNLVDELKQELEEKLLELTMGKVRFHIKFNLLFRANDLILPSSETRKTRMLCGTEWDPDFSKPNTGMLEEVGKQLDKRKVLFVGKGSSKEDRMTAKNFGCDYILTKDLLKHFKGTEKHLSKDNLPAGSAIRLSKEADEWLTN